ncbi:G-protein coupled receptor 135-like isoform X2 [Brachyhypopomus gauderio]|uniref:G-protein coupled receptor 135-like isoform X2 n=1 Tax=Brachyhypopomus gauderio TaxID=698409 RepID=UPI00404224EA
MDVPVSDALTYSPSTSALDNMSRSALISQAVSPSPDLDGLAAPVGNGTGERAEERALHGAAVATQALLLLAIFLMSSLGNSAVVVVIIKHRQLRTVTNAFIMSLSLSDLLTAILCLPFSFMMLFSKDGTWMFGDRFCVANGFFNTCFGIISTLTMTLISFDRYYAIVRQPQEKIGRTKAMQLLVAVWLWAVLLSSPWYLVLRSPERVVVHKRGFYHCMTVRLCETRVRPVTTYAHLLRFYSEMRTATTVLVMIVFIILCWGPYCLMGIITAMGDLSFNPAMDTVAIWMAWANGAINPLIYAIRNPNISMLLGRSREEGYRTRNIAAYLSTQTQRGEVRTRYVGRLGAGSRLSSSSPAQGGEVAMWACRNPAVLFCRDGHPDTVTESVVPKVETANTSL